MTKEAKLPPIHPGEVLNEEFLRPMNITQYRLAKAIGVDARRIHSIVRGERAVTAETALLLSSFFGNSPPFWMGLQSQYDLETTQDRLAERLDWIAQQHQTKRVVEHRNSSSGETAEPHQPSAGRFADVPPGHPNEEDIYLVVRSGIVRDTSANRYGPLQAVTREEVALFLIRLAALVGIEVPPAGDAGFSDVGQLPYESRAAVDQLTTHLGISYGTSPTTFSPSQAVTRGQMALFLQRLMNRIPLLQERGRTPADVIHKTQVSEAGTPFTDLGMVTVATYNAIVQLHLLGVASGISSTAYAPSALITRASMAGFIARVLDVVERERDDEIPGGSRGSDAGSAALAGGNRRSAAHLFDRYDPDPLDEEAERIAKEGPRGPHDTAFYVPHQQEDRLVEFDLLTATVDDIISRCGYSEDERSELAEAHRRMAEHDLRFYRGPLPESIPLLEGTQ